MWHQMPRPAALAVAVVLLVAACGDSGSATTTVAAKGDGGAEVGMTTARLCDPIEDLVMALTGTGAATEHNTVYANSAEPILVCSWLDDDTDWEIGVGYNGAPGDFMVELTEGKNDLATVDAPNTYSKSRLDARAPNGWSITVHNYGADAPDDPAALASIANAALDLIGS